MTQNEIIEKIVTALDKKKAEDIKAINIHDLTILADYFIIASGNSTTQTKALADEVEYQLSLVGIEPTRTEGHSGSTWTILDYSDILVHIFYKETREFYSLERLWSDGKEMDISHLVTAN
ncbi:MAG: ribosome silencing factor [Oscillospiraceae bacterium]|nr:ribosome silencing factor [Oscillospiraceae bacterium]MBR4092494.1 ribosome silencing factor [Oscillospiraceae bacterium]